MSEDSLWSLMSGQAHADFNAYANLSATLDEARRIIHGIGPCRQPPWDNIWLWLTARQLTTVLACVLKVCAHIDQRDFLAVAEQVVTAEERLGEELGAAHSGEGGARQVGED